MAHDLDALLQQFSDDAYSVRLVRGVTAVVPFAEDPGSWFSVVEGLKQARPDAKKPLLDQVVGLSKEDGPQKALWIFDALDKADTGISAVSGLGGAWKMYQATTSDERIDALETDTQQAVDAVISDHLHTIPNFPAVGKGGLAQRSPRHSRRDLAAERPSRL